MTKMNGHTYDTPIKTRLRNLADIAGADALLTAAAMSDGDPHECERILTGMAHDALRNEAELAEIQGREADWLDYHNTIESVRPF
jgi:hypothetical protein